MNQELQRIENKKVGQRSTGSNCSFSSLNSLVNGNDFLTDVVGSGASAALVSDPPRAMKSPSGLSLLQVQDTLTALHKLATNYRRLMPPTTRLVAVTGVYQGEQRMTLTYEALARADRLLWLVTGEDKRSALSALLRGDSTIPASGVTAPSSLVMADRAALGT